MKTGKKSKGDIIIVTGGGGGGGGGKFKGGGGMKIIKVPKYIPIPVPMPIKTQIADDHSYGGYEEEEHGNDWWRRR